MSELVKQIGGTHYKNMAIQPLEYSMANNFNACQHSVLKYISRYKEKGGREDLLKARDMLDKLIEFEYGDEALAVETNWDWSPKVHKEWHPDQLAFKYEYNTPPPEKDQPPDALDWYDTIQWLGERNG